MKRTHYENGDAITLACGCDGCSPVRVNGILCHETGCPDGWRDRAADCVLCGCDFMPEERGQNICPDCIADEQTATDGE